MSGTQATLPSSQGPLTGDVPDALSGSEGHAASATSWAALRQGVGPMILIAVAVVIVWYGLGFYDDVPFAQQILGAKASLTEVLGTAMSLPMPFVPFPHQVLGDFFASLSYPLDSTRGLWLHMGTTGLEALLGLLAGAVLGILIATVFVHSRPIEAAFLPYVVASQTVPILAVAPIVIGILGITLAAKT